MASWRSGYAEDCKSLYSGSNPDEASTHRFIRCDFLQASDAADRLWPVIGCTEIQFWENRMLHARIAEAQSKLDAARRELKHAAINFDVSDEALLEARATARKIYDELKILDAKKLSRQGLFGFLKFW